jgi:hypothetical protein
MASPDSTGFSGKTQAIDIVEVIFSLVRQGTCPNILSKRKLQ